MSAFNDIVKQLSSRVHLREDERARMQHNIREYMAHTPVRSARATETPTSFIALVQYRFTAVLVAVAVLLTSGVGVVFASNDALPGDALYAIKEAKRRYSSSLFSMRQNKQSLRLSAHTADYKKLSCLLHEET